jgi:dihydroorotase
MDTVQLRKVSFTVPMVCSMGDENVVPFFAGRELSWAIVEP